MESLEDEISGFEVFQPNGYVKRKNVWYSSWSYPKTPFSPPILFFEKRYRGLQNVQRPHFLARYLFTERNKTLMWTGKLTNIFRFAWCFFLFVYWRLVQLRAMKKLTCRTDWRALSQSDMLPFHSACGTNHSNRSCRILRKYNPHQSALRGWHYCLYGSKCETSDSAAAVKPADLPLLYVAQAQYPVVDVSSHM